jgi:hypothetical protein
MIIPNLAFEHEPVPVSCIPLPYCYFTYNQSGTIITVWFIKANIKKLCEFS